MTLLDCGVTYPAAASYALGSVQEAGSATALAEILKCQAFETFGDSADHDLVPLAIGCC